MIAKKAKSTRQLTHFDAAGAAHMVDVAAKDITHRTAVAEGSIAMQAETLALILGGGHRKGDVLGIARVAGILAAKRTSDLIPLCHPLALTHIGIEFMPDGHRCSIRVLARVETDGKTGVEMEALTAVQITLLTIYDMCKAVDRAMTMKDIRLVEKTGGKSGHWRRGVRQT